jgi:lysozyme
LLSFLLLLSPASKNYNSKPFMPKKQVASKKQNNRLSLILLLAFLAVGIYLVKRLFFSPAFKHYTAFGIDLPVNYSVHGIDVSHHQGNINWEMVKNMKDKNVSLKFAFIKATEGVGLDDRNFKDNYEAAKEQGLLVGAYHFFIPFRSGAEQADNFLDEAIIKKGDLRPVLDIEQNSGVAANVMKQRIKDWLNKVENATGVKPIIYTNVDYYNNYIAGDFDDYPLWIAHYKVKNKPNVNANWALWQHSETGNVSGINTTVDFNVFNGSMSDLEELQVP